MLRCLPDSSNRYGCTPCDARCELTVPPSDTQNVVEVFSLPPLQRLRETGTTCNRIKRVRGGAYAAYLLALSEAHSASGPALA
jgi:hypothetical protein